MIAAIWNVRGINKPLKRKRILTFARQNHVSFFALLETRTTPSRLEKIINGIFPSENVFVDFNTIRSGRIVLVWNSHKVECTVLDVSPQCIHCSLCCKVSKKSFLCTIVYGLYSVVERRDLWTKLNELSPQCNLPWMVCGDFNVVRGPEEKQGGIVPSHYFTKDFIECCSSLDLSDAPSIGNFYTWTNGRVKAKLDRVLINSPWSGGNVNCWVEFKEFDCISDHCPILLKLFNSQEAFNKPFKFFNMWLSHPNFLQIIEDNWRLTVHGSKQYIFVRRLKALKAPLKTLNKEEFGHISERAKRANAEYNDLLNSTDLNSASSEDRAKIQSLRSRASFLAEAERQFVTQKLKLKHLIDADKCSKYFHDLIKKSNIDRSITCIRDHQGNPTTSISQIGALFVDHFKGLLGSSLPRLHCNAEFLNNGPKISDSHLFSLVATVSNLEIKNALFGISDQKAPGPDGFSAAFFKKNWNRIGEDLVDAVKEFFSTGQLLKQINHTVIALIPKVQQPQSVGDYRPISCCNVLYKVISRVLAARLSVVLPGIINHAQAAFVEGRSMSDNIFLAQELIRGYARKRISPRCMLMVDLRKAYDTIEWDFILEVLNGLGFPSQFTQWIAQCVTTTSFSISINGGIFGNFKGKKGLRQGDPISPLLFACCIEYLSRTLSSLTARPGFSFHPKCSKFKISHLAFADDLMLFSRGDQNSVQVLLDALKELELASGLTVNINKSNLFVAGVRDNRLDFVNFPKGTLPIRYLGVPLDAQRLKVACFSPLTNSVASLINAWKSCKLTFAGRLELLSSVIQGVISFWLQNFLLPNNVVDHITSLCRNFLWGSRFAPIAWDKICCPKEEGGLGLHNFKTWNIAFLARVLWDIHSKRDSLWIKWVNGEYLDSKDLWLWNPKARDSALMKSISAVKEALIKHTGSDHLARCFLLNAFKNNRFHISAVYDLIRHKSSPHPCWRFTWRSYLPHKFSFILWMALKNRLPTRDRICSEDHDPFCSLCIGSKESSNHLFFSCPFSLQVWSCVRDIIGFPKNTTAIRSTIKWIRKLYSGSRPHSKGFSMALASSVYHIWRFRNLVLHDEERPPIEGLVKIIASDIFRIAAAVSFL